MKKLLFITTVILLLLSRVALFPDENIDEQWKKVDVLIENQEYEEAIKETEKIKELADDAETIANVNWQIGYCYNSINDLNNANTYYFKALNYFKDNITLIENIISVYYNLNELEKLEEFGNNKMKEFPDNFELKSKVLYYFLGYKINIEKYLPLAIEIEDKEINDTGLPYYIACIFSLKDEKEKAVNYIDKMIYNYNDDVEGLKKGLEWMQKDSDLDNIRKTEYYKRLFNNQEGLLKGITNFYEAKKYEKKSDYNDAIEYYTKSINNFKSSLGNNGLRLAASYNNIGLVYDKMGQYDKALEYYFLALEIFKGKLGNDHLNVATSYNNIGSVYVDMGQYDKALEYHFMALEIYRKQLGDDHTDIALSYNNIGTVYYIMGQYDKTLEYFFLSLEISKAKFGNDHQYVATSYNNIGTVYHNMGQYEKALEYYFVAIEILKAKLGNDHQYVATSYNNIGTVYHSMDQYDKALEYYFLDLDILKSKFGDDHPSVATSYNNIGVVYDNMGQYDKALEYHFMALEISEKKLGADHPDVATSYNNIGDVYKYMGLYDKALEYHFMSLEIKKKKLGIDHPKVAQSYNNIGDVYKYMGQYDKARENYIKSINIKEKLRSNISNDKKTKAEYFATMISTYYSLIKCLYNLNEKEDAYFYSSSTKSRALLDEVSMDVLFNSKDIDKKYIDRLNELKSEINITNNIITAKKQNNINTDQEEIKVSKLSTEYQKALSEVYKKYPKYKELSEGRVLTLKEIQKHLDKNEIILEYSIDNKNNGFVFVLGKDSFEMIELDNSKVNEYKKNIELFREITIGLEGQLYYLEEESGIIYKDKNQLLDDRSRGIKTGDQKDSKNDKEKSYRIIDGEEVLSIINDRLYNAFIEPVSKYLTKDKDVIIIPDKELALLPFEALKDADGKYLIESYNISYNQSSTLLVKSKTRKITSTKPLLGFGGALYEGKKKVDNKETLALSDKEREYYRAQYDNQFAKRGGLKELYSKRGYYWSNLPGTEDEIKEIGKLFYKSDKDKDYKNSIILKDKVTEDRLSEMNGIKALEDYKIIHFATHGMVDYEIPEASSIILSQMEGTEEDGYFTLVEILNLYLNCELVTLSACETGLGKIVGGEGVTGLAQSFIMAGSNNVCVSLWQVSDQATKDFMISFYSKVRSGMTYKDAIIVTKREFIKGKWASPYFWSGFVLYGE